MSIVKLQWYTYTIKSKAEVNECSVDYINTVENLTEKKNQKIEM